MRQPTTVPKKKRLAGNVVKAQNGQCSELLSSILLKGDAYKPSNYFLSSHVNDNALDEA